MEEQKKIERDLMSQEEFEDYISKGIIVLHLITYDGVHRFKSVRRAMRRGHVTAEGIDLLTEEDEKAENSNFDSERSSVHE